MSVSIEHQSVIALHVSQMLRLIQKAMYQKQSKSKNEPHACYFSHIDKSRIASHSLGACKADSNPPGSPGLHVAMRSNKPPPPLMYRMMGTWGWVALAWGGGSGGVSAAGDERSRG